MTELQGIKGLVCLKIATNKDNDVLERKDSPCLNHAWAVFTHLLGVSFLTCSKIDPMQVDRYCREPNLAPLRSAIGMLEYWNDGIMGSGKMG
jgi:hypothetical protein